ncbi:MAG: radical SAM protein [Rikenellaceae bacterium]
MALIFDIKHFAINDGDGIRTTVFFKGCPLRCRWCHNPEGIKGGVESFAVKRLFDSVEIETIEKVGRIVTVEEIFEEIEKDMVFYANSKGGGVTFSGGEPLRQIDELLKLLALCKERGIHTAVDTSGCVESYIFDRLTASGLVDLILFDIKGVDSDLHKKGTGRDNNLILENLKSLKDSSIRTILRFPAIPIYTYTAVNVDKMVDLISEIKCDNISEISLLPYHDIARGKYSKYSYEYLMPKSLKSMPKASLEDLKMRLEGLGWSVKIG